MIVAPKPVPEVPPPMPSRDKAIWKPLGVSRSLISRFVQRFSSNDLDNLNCQQVRNFTV